MVVDGNLEFVGSREKDASKAFGKAVLFDKGVVELEVIGFDSERFGCKTLSDHEDASVFVAVAEDNLSSSIERGENTGKNLTHLGVVGVFSE